MSMLIPNARRVLAYLEQGFRGPGASRHSWNELRKFSDRDLRDISLHRSDAIHDAAKPFWMAWVFTGVTAPVAGAELFRMA
jgi:uncharacterized protein YjiS (DUF1127 family)